VVVGEEKITAQAFWDKWESLLRLGGETLKPSSSSSAQIKQKLLQDLISEELLIQEARRRNISLSSGEVEERISTLKGNLSDSEFRRLFLEHYIDQDEWRKGIERNLLIEKLLLEAVRSLTPPTDEELKVLYHLSLTQWTIPARIRLYQILLDQWETAKKVEQILQRGGNFYDLARRYGIGPEAKRNGELGWVTVSDLHPALKPAESLPLHKTSRVITSPYGYHILMVTARQPQRILSFQEALPLLRQQAFYDQKESARTSLLLTLRERTPVTIYADVWNQILSAP
jgi:parvulin-like peptidyl-prolyl isomerase